MKDMREDIDPRIKSIKEAAQSFKKAVQKLDNAINLTKDSMDKIHVEGETCWIDESFGFKKKLF